MTGNRDAVDVLTKLALFYAANRRANASSVSPPMASFYDPSDLGFSSGQSGEDRFDELIDAYGSEIADFESMKQWKRMEERLALLASEMRFRVFKEREDACRAIANMIHGFLWSAHYAQLNTGFYNEFKKCLENHCCYEKELLRCIRKFFRHP